MKQNKLLIHNLKFPSDIKRVTSELFDKLAPFAMGFGFLATVTSLSRIIQFGWQINIIIDIGTYLLIITLLQARRKLPTMLVATLFLLLLFTNACFNIIFTGFVTSSMIMLCSCCVVAGSIFGFRTGVLLLLTSTLFITITASLFSLGIFCTVFDMKSYLLSPLAWLSQISGFLVFSLACLTVVHFMQEKLIVSIRQLETRSEELHASEKKFRLLAENMHDVLLLLDNHLHITYISPSVEAIFGYRPDMLTGTRIDILAPVESSALLLTRFSEFIATSSPTTRSVEPFECMLSDKNGTAVPAEFTPSLIRNDTAVITGVQCILRDLTTQKKSLEEKSHLEKQLRHSEKLEVIGQLAGGVAHDFNNQLAGILGFAELIKTDHADIADVYANAQSIASIAKHSADLTGKLLAFARKGKFLSKVFDLHATINDTIDILSRSIDRSITIDRKLTAADFYVKGDPAQIQNALLNIAINARDAMQKGGVLNFTTNVCTLDTSFTSPYQQAVVPGRYIHITLTDTGTGIDDETKQHLFEPFYTTKAPGKGTGMGLAAVYGTIQTHGGAVNVTSRVSEGTTFHIYLPLSNETPSLPERENTAHIKRGTGNILIIEDEVNVRKMMEMIITRFGYSVTLCCNGNEGLATYQQNPASFSGVIIDLILPGISGKELINSIRSINSRARILICSGYRADVNIQKLVDDTKTLFIQKPFSMNELSTMLSTLLTVT